MADFDIEETLSRLSLSEKVDLLAGLFLFKEPKKL